MADDTVINNIALGLKNIDLEQRKFLREKEVEQIFGINRNTLRRQRWGLWNSFKMILDILLK